MTQHIPLSSGILNAERERWYSHILTVMKTESLSLAQIHSELEANGIKQNGKGLNKKFTMPRYLAFMEQRGLITRVEKPVGAKRDIVYYRKV